MHKLTFLAFRLGLNTLSSTKNITLLADSLHYTTIGSSLPKPNAPCPFDPSGPRIMMDVLFCCSQFGRQHRDVEKALFTCALFCNAYYNRFSEKAPYILTPLSSQVV